MPFTAATLNALGTSLAGLCGYASLHLADPGTTGANESSAGRQAVSFTVDAGGNLSLTATASFTGGEPNGVCKYVGLWSAATGGTFRGGFRCDGGDTYFNYPGEYDLTGLDVTSGS